MANLWLNLCANERLYISFKVVNDIDILKKTELRKNYKAAQQVYDKRYRYYKRRSKKESQEQLATAASDNPADMWAKLKKLGEPVNNKVAMEIVRQDGTISRDVVEVLERWHRDIAQLFSGIRQDPDVVFDDRFYNEILEKKNEFEKLSDTHTVPIHWRQFFLTVRKKVWCFFIKNANIKY